MLQRQRPARCSLRSHMHAGEVPVRRIEDHAWHVNEGNSSIAMRTIAEGAAAVVSLPAPHVSCTLVGAEKTIVSKTAATHDIAFFYRLGKLHVFLTTVQQA